MNNSADLATSSDGIVNEMQATVTHNKESNAQSIQLPNGMVTIGGVEMPEDVAQEMGLLSKQESSPEQEPEAAPEIGKSVV